MAQNYPADNEALNRLTEQYHNRLRDLGWFMGFLNQPVARHANKEDIFEFSANIILKSY